MTKRIVVHMAHPLYRGKTGRFADLKETEGWKALAKKRTLCWRPKAGLEVTEDLDKVTCKTCRRKSGVVALFGKVPAGVPACKACGLPQEKCGCAEEA